MRKGNTPKYGLQATHFRVGAHNCDNTASCYQWSMNGNDNSEAEEALKEGRDIRLLREKLGWSQSDLASHAGTSQQTVDRIERGETLHSRALPRIRMALLKQAGRPAAARERDERQLDILGLTRSYLPTYAAVCPVYFLGDHGKLQFYQFTSGTNRPGQYMISINTQEYQPELSQLDGLIVSTLEFLTPEPGDLVVYYSKEAPMPGPFMAGEEIELGKVTEINADTALVQPLGGQSQNEPLPLNRRFWQINRVDEIIRRGRRTIANKG
jgi:transcriptional regulator with XRE-family HTH domain